MATERSDDKGWQPDGLDEALQEAFGGDGDTPLSVLATLRPGEAPAGAVLLREDDGVPSPVVSPRRGAEGRYRIVGEVARGGVGVVLKGHDVDLGRDVAVKMLREEHAEKPEVIQRFIEEAQIGGQLQHPGIVPVYEMGLGRERRPFFSMKLVKGRTLASLLADRAEPATDGQRFLRIFESACQTVAYAHARGVIHRDLKPANIMVGAFGEVLVVDWGMGKVLSQGGTADEMRSRVPAEPERSVIETIRSDGSGSASIVGSVLGTPRYMPPEQARGEIDRVDERADVFALGAILCEILTGQPPYTGTDQEVFGQAARGEVSAAVERLSHSGADEALVQLATTCLAPAPAARPRDASVVAKEVADYLASLEQKARAAQVDAAAATVRAHEERRRRKLGWALAAALIGFVVLGTGAWTWRQVELRRQTDQIAGQIDHAAAAAARLRAAAETTSAADSLAKLGEARAHAERAYGLAQGEHATSAMRERIRQLLGSIESDVVAAETRRSRRERDVATQRRLESIRADRADTWDEESTAEAYAEVLGGYLDIDPEADPPEAARRIEASVIRGDLLAAIDDWLEMRRRLEMAPGRLVEVLDRADPDPWRARIRAAAGDDDALARLGDELDLEAVPAATLVQLSRRLGEAGDMERARTVAALAWRMDPTEFWATFECGRWHERSVPSLAESAARYYTAAVALRPRSAAAHNNLGAALVKAERLEQGVESLRTALALRPDYALALCNLGSALYFLGHIEESEGVCRRAAEVDPELAWAFNNLGNALGGLGRLEEALVAYTESMRVDATEAGAYYNRGQALRDLGRIPEAIVDLKEAVRLRGERGHSNALVTLGNIYLDQQRFEEAIAVHEKNLRLHPLHAQSHGCLGHAQRRAGKFEEALTTLRMAVHLDPENPWVWRNLGDTLEDLGRFEEALQAYDTSVRLDASDATTHMNRSNVFARTDRLEEALDGYRRAIALEPELAIAHMNLGNALMRLGQLDDAIEFLRRSVELGADLACVHFNLANLLGERGAYREAIDEYREALRIEPTHASALNNLGLALREAGDFEGAVDSLRRAIETKPDHGGAWLNLAQTLGDLGRFEEAVEASREGGRLAAGNPKLEAVAARALEKDERAFALSKQLPSVAAGEAEPASPEEALALAEIARILHRNALAARLAAYALEQRPISVDAPGSILRYNAVCVAVLAGTGQPGDGVTLTDAEGARCREQGLAWLRTELRSRRTRGPDDPAAFQGWLRHVLVDPDLTGVRDAAALAKLPEEEKKAWAAFWKEIQTLLE